jgi:hypothetical protein
MVVSHTDLFSSHMGHGSAYPLTLCAHLMFAFCGVVSNDISFSPMDVRSGNLFISFYLLSFSIYIQP